MKSSPGNTLSRLVRKLVRLTDRLPSEGKLTLEADPALDQISALAEELRFLADLERWKLGRKPTYRAP